jgi:phage gpG-like protein
MAGDQLVQIKPTFDVDDLVDSVEDMRKRARDFLPVFKKIQAELEEVWANNFMTNGLPSGGWAPLDPGYAAWKSVHFPGMPPMIRSGKLFSSLGNLRGAPNVIRNRSASFGTPVKYAEFHQYGTTRMPMRRVVFEPLGSSKVWAGWAADHMANGSR